MLKSQKRNPVCNFVTAGEEPSVPAQPTEEHQEANGISAQLARLEGGRKLGQVRQDLP